MKFQTTITLSLFALSSALSAQTIFNGYAYVSDTTAGVDANWYNLSGTAQGSGFNGANLGNFTNALWLGGQTGFWSDSQGVEYIKMNYNITGSATATGSVDYEFQSYSAPNDQQGTDVSGAVTSDLSTNIIAAHSLGAGTYNIAVWVEGKANNRAAIFDSNNSNNYTAAFTVVPENSMLALLSGSFFLLYVMLKRRLS